MKLYDKEIWSKNIRVFFFVLGIFFVSFFLGFYFCKIEKEKIIEEKETIIIDQQIELDSLRETVHMYELYGK